MNHLLFCSTPAPGHVNPLLTIAISMAELGYEVTFATAEVFRSRVEAANLQFVPFEGIANYDYKRPGRHFPGRASAPAGIPRLIFDFKHVFGDPLIEQYRTIQKICARKKVDLILTDSTFAGTLPLLLSAERRPPVISFGIMPVFVTSADRPPIGNPVTTPGVKADYLAEHRAFQSALQPVDEYLNGLLSDLHLPSLPTFIFDSLLALPDRYLQLSAESFEYPCSDLPSTVRFVGPLTPKSSNDFNAPNWWHLLDSEKPVVLVTQGTIANSDLSELIEPALAGLADEDVTVIAVLGSTEPRKVALQVPPNATVVDFVPFEQILPRTSLFITNGGYGGVNQALQIGVPIIVAGMTEDKPHVAARVAWTGCGIDLQTQHPTPDQIRSAARQIFADPSFREKSAAISEDFRRHDALKSVEEEVSQILKSAALQRDIVDLTLA